MRVDAPIEHIPIFVRAGARIPVCEGMTYAAEEKPVEHLFYPERKKS